MYCEQQSLGNIQPAEVPGGEKGKLLYILFPPFLHSVIINGTKIKSIIAPEFY